MKIKYPLLLDGGLSNELEKQGQNLNHKLWSAKLLETNPEAIIQAHLAYLNAGAQCITTSSYQASVPGFMEIGYDQATAEKLILKSVQLTEIAIKRFWHTFNALACFHNFTDTLNLLRSNPTTSSNDINT